MLTPASPSTPAQIFGAAQASPDTRAGADGLVAVVAVAVRPRVAAKPRAGRLLRVARDTAVEAAGQFC